MIKNNKFMSIWVFALMIIGLIFSYIYLDIQNKNTLLPLNEETKQIFFLNPHLQFDDIVDFDECKPEEIGGYNISGGIKNNSNKITLIFTKNNFKIMVDEGAFFNIVDKIQQQYNYRLCDTYKYMLEQFN